MTTSAAPSFIAKRLIPCAAAIVVNCLSVNPCCGEVLFQVEYADSSETTLVQSTSIAIDAIGRHHIAYQDLLARKMKYATKNAGNWTLEIISDGRGNSAATTSIAIDSQGNPHLIYGGPADQYRLYYARRLAGNWTAEEAAGYFAGYHSSLILDQSDNPHISYEMALDHDLLYAKKVSGAWSREKVDAAGNELKGWHTSIALDPGGNPHISYINYSRNDLMYARKLMGAWHIETVDTSASAFYSGTSLDLDQEGRACIGYLNASNSEIRYATRSASGWSRETVDRAGANGFFYCSATRDALQRIHLAYYAAASRSEMYASKEAGAWTHQRIELAPHVDTGWSAIAVDAQSRPHISYSSGSGDDLKYAFGLTEPPNAIFGLFALDAVPHGDDIAVHWGVRARDEFLGFNIWRAGDGAGFLRASAYMIPSAADNYPAILSWIDSTVERGVNYAYRIEVIRPDGTSELWDETVEAGVRAHPPSHTALRIVGPNPFRATEGLAFEVESPVSDPKATIRAFDVSGRLVATFFEGAIRAGSQRGQWKGADGASLPAGRYVLRLEAGGGTAAAMVFLVR